MSDIELVIKIPKEMYAQIINENGIDTMLIPYKDIIKNGKPLDLEGLKSDMKALNCGFPYGLDYLLDCLDKRLGITIIEADKEQTDGND